MPLGDSVIVAVSGDRRDRPAILEVCTVALVHWSDGCVDGTIDAVQEF